MSKAQQIQDRIEKANQLLRVIATRGRCFFSHKHEDGLVIARFRRQENGSIWLLNEWTKEWIYVSRRNNNGTYKGFHHGGTLRALVTALVAWIREEDLVSPHYFNKHWGYSPREIEQIVSTGYELEIVWKPLDNPSTGRSRQA